MQPFLSGEVVNAVLQSSQQGPTLTFMMDFSIHSITSRGTATAISIGCCVIYMLGPGESTVRCFVVNIIWLAYLRTAGAASPTSAATAPPLELDYSHLEEWKYPSMVSTNHKSSQSIRKSSFGSRFCIDIPLPVNRLYTHQSASDIVQHAPVYHSFHIHSYLTYNHHNNSIMLS